MEFKDLGRFFAQLVPGSLLKFFKFTDGFAEGVVRSLDFLLDIFFLDRAMRNLLLRFAKTKHRPNDDAGGNRDAANDVHG